MRSCLIIFVIIVLGILVYNMYQRFQEPTDGPQLTREYDPEFRQAVLDALTPMVDQNPNIDYITLDGSILDLHYRTPVSQSQYRDDASHFAIAFSRKKQEQLNTSDVVVRCIEGNLIRVEVSADNGRVRSLEEF